MSTICDHVDDELSAHRDGEGNRLRQWCLAVHLRRCERCASASNDLGEVDSHIRHAVLATEAPDYLTAAVMRRLPAMPPARRRRFAGSRWLLGAGCVVLQAVSLWGAYRAGCQRTELRQPAPVSPPHSGLLRPMLAPARQAAGLPVMAGSGSLRRSRALLSSTAR
jgi:predicted anti-sigma-YlaC factor YlaD